jgi:hypothetical protein
MQQEERVVAVDREFLARVERAETRHVPTEEEVHESYESLWRDAGAKKQKHKRQESALLAHLDLSSVTDVVEFGCGVASLSAHIAAVACARHHDAAEEEPKKPRVEPRGLRFHLLDRMSFRSNVRQDKVIRKLGCAVNRCTMDVRDLHFDASFGAFGKTDESEQEREYAFVSKHFCGFATDLALKLFVEQDKKKNVQLAIAGCCHALCQRDLFFGDLNFLENELQIDFERLKRISGWATIDSADSESVDELGLTRREKKSLGEKAKLIFEEARARNLPPNVRLVRYTSQSVERLLFTTGSI